ncbi:histidine phosphatase family protein [Paenibacillus doosanensis]|uniref:Phosphoserine phosphatase 1 n=1 Tax=Paenibacillus konkukensis TaxID=2020716 RepID=A0ABY4RIS5_9BACL|nr:MULTISPECIES: histidine phosphatase family protein [Paenibacillus]MCS7461657.1 histidine phosphatase family protein [Paenibacillus doosanensis]UQZ82083.1 Phosphoserine phosphatase 1 [Paenibacillus konkukensis]
MEKKTTMYLTRHGETEWNVEKRMQGHSDSPLTPLGVFQAACLGDALRTVPFDAIYSSSSKRTVATAEVIRGSRQTAIIAQDALREIRLGEWEGKTGSYIREKDPEAYRMFWNEPHLYQPANQGESFYELYDRVIPWIKEAAASHLGEQILIVTHAITLKLLMAYFEGRPLAELWSPPILEPTALCKVVIQDGKECIELHGDTSHYRELKL